MKLAVISFTRKGSKSCAKLVKQFLEQGEECSGYLQERFLDSENREEGLIPLRESLTSWTRTQFSQADGLIFIGAAGIAVRAIAPFIKDKKTDPAVIVTDEQGTWAISLLSGHMGGANQLAEMVAKVLNGQAVITTATDIEGKIAVDLLAKEAGLVISDRELAKQVSADLLEDKQVGFFSDYSWPLDVPKGFTSEECCQRAVWVTARNRWLDQEMQVLRLVPKVYCVGIGCRKGTAAENIKHNLIKIMQEYNLAVEGIRSFASIDIKKEEAGILALAAEWEIPFQTFTAAELSQAAGEFSSSAFVKQITGVDNVCERAALLAAGGEGALLVRKQAGAGITIAVAALPWKKEKRK